MPLLNTNPTPTTWFSILYKLLTGRFHPEPTTQQLSPEPTPTQTTAQNNATPQQKSMSMLHDGLPNRPYMVPPNSPAPQPNTTRPPVPPNTPESRPRQACDTPPPPFALPR